MYDLLPACSASHVRSTVMYLRRSHNARMPTKQEEWPDAVQLKFQLVLPHCFEYESDTCVQYRLELWK